MSDEYKRPAILEELDSFNTAPQAESLMLGILQEEEQNASRREQWERNQDSGAQLPAKIEPGSEVENTQTSDHYLPLNTSIQELDKRFDGRLTQLERSIHNLSNNFQETRQQPQQQYPQQQQEEYDPDAPVTAYQMKVLADRQNIAHQMAERAFKHNLSTRAHLELQRFQQKNPDFAMDPRQLDHAIDQFARQGKLDQLEGANWTGHFEQLYSPQRDVKYETQSKEIERLSKELEALKKSAGRTTAPPQPVSPATGRSTRAASIQTPLESSNDDRIVKLKSFSQKGNFKGFAKDLKGLTAR